MRLCTMLCTYIPDAPAYSQAACTPSLPFLRLWSAGTTIKTVSTAMKKMYGIYSSLCICLYSPDKTTASPRKIVKAYDLDMVCPVSGQN